MIENADALAVDGIISFEELAPGYPAIRVTHPQATATIALHGAHVIDYTPAGHEPVIFTSKDAVYKAGKAIRGGIPVCWPWFNAHPTDSSLPSHGFARINFWRLYSTAATDQGVTLIFEYRHGSLDASLIVAIGSSLTVALHTKNISDRDEVVGGALHSYFNIGDIHNVSLSGLDKVDYIDTLVNTNETQEGEITFDGELDRIYTNTKDDVIINDPVMKRDIIVQKTGSTSTVVWNPWIDKSAGMGDLDNEEYKTFLCVEAANAREDVYTLAPQEQHTLSTTITARHH